MGPAGSNVGNLYWAFCGGQWKLQVDGGFETDRMTGKRAAGYELGNVS